MLRCWKTWTYRYKQTRFALAILMVAFGINISALAQQSVLQPPSSVAPDGADSESQMSGASARIISGMIQFEPATPMQPTANPNLPLSNRSPIRIQTQVHNLRNQAANARSYPNQNGISQATYQTDGGAAPRYSPNDPASRPIPRYLVPPNSGGRGKNLYAPNRFAFRQDQDEDPFGESQPQRPRGNNRNPFGNKPQEGRIDPFADPPQNNIVPPEAPRRDPFNDPPNRIPDQGMNPRDTVPRQDDYQEPGLPGEIPDYGPSDQDLPIPDPRRNGGYDNGGSDNGSREPQYNNRPTSARPIRRAPTTHYGPSRRGQFQDQYGDDNYQPSYFADNYQGGYQNNYQNGYDNYREPLSGDQPSYAIPQYQGIVDQIGLDGYCNNCLDQPYSCCEPLFYISVFGGYSDSEIDGLAVERRVEVPTLGQYQLDDGYGFGFAIGQTQGANLRTELEYSFRSNDATTFELNNLADLDLSGDVSASSGMFNFAWDFNNIQSVSRIRPYIGGGVGFSFVDADLEYDTNTKLHTTDIDNDTAFAWQAFAGITYQFSTSMNFFVEYRHFDVSGLTLESQPDTDTVLFGDFDYRVNNLFAGFRLRF